MDKSELIDKHRDISVDHDWWEFVYADFDQICKIIGLELDDTEPSFSGFWSQGDGASFTGHYRAWQFIKGYKQNLHYETAPERIREYAPLDKELHRIADELCMLGRIYFPPYARITRYETSRYVHEYTMDFDCEPMGGDIEDWADEVLEHVQHEVKELMKDLARWLYAALEREYDHLTSDEQVWETIKANELHEGLEV